MYLTNFSTVNCVYILRLQPLDLTGYFGLRALLALRPENADADADAFNDDADDFNDNDDDDFADDDDYLKTCCYSEQLLFLPHVRDPP